MTDVARLVPTKSDAELAAEYRARMEVPLKEICAILNEAKSAGLIIGYTTSVDQFGRYVPQNLTVVRPL